MGRSANELHVNCPEFRIVFSESLGVPAPGDLR
jgi:hypothetical protein